MINRRIKCGFFSSLQNAQKPVSVISPDPPSSSSCVSEASEHPSLTSTGKDPSNDESVLKSDRAENAQNLNFKEIANNENVIKAYLGEDIDA